MKKVDSDYNKVNNNNNNDNYDSDDHGCNDDDATAMIVMARATVIDTFLTK